jgi:hypothetical protein
MGIKYFIIVIVVVFLSCLRNQTKTVKNAENGYSQWIIHHDTIDAGFILTFKYPNDLVFADIIDNCRCVVKRTKHYDINEAAANDNTRQWCICMQDTADCSINYLISSWKTVFNEEVIEKRDTVTIGNLKTLRVTLKSKEPNASYRQLIYLKKYSTLFEIMNVDESTSKDFEVFSESIKIEGYKKP